MSADASQRAPGQRLAPGHRGRKRRRGARRRNRRARAGGRSHHAVGRSGRGQDDAGARAHPAALRRSRARSAEPHVHADADLRRRAFPHRACRSLPGAIVGRTRRARLGRGRGRRARPRGMGRQDGRRDRAATGSTSPCGSTRSAARTIARSCSPATAPSPNGCSAHARSPNCSTLRLGRRDAHVHAGRRLGARLRAAAEARWRTRHPDDLAAAAGRAARCATASPTAPSRGWRRRSRPSSPWRRRCAAKGLSAPKILASDTAAGLAIIEDLGAEGVRRGRRARSPSAIARRRRSSPSCIPPTRRAPFPAPAGSPIRIPPYDLDALLIEVELLVEWYAPHICGVKLSSAAKAIFLSLWRSTLTDIANARSTWVLRDYHSPNLIWLPERQGLARVGVIDFQDCVLGHPAYDVASLLQDARVTVPDDLELRLLSHYALARGKADPDFVMSDFARRLRRAGRAARHQGAWHFHPPRPARRQAGLSRAHPARRACARQEPRTSGACGHQRLV